jgi:hypothetical protein
MSQSGKRYRPLFALHGDMSAEIFDIPAKSGGVGPSVTSCD